MSRRAARNRTGMGTSGRVDYMSIMRVIACEACGGLVWACEAGKDYTEPLFKLDVNCRGCRAVYDMEFVLATGSRAKFCQLCERLLPLDGFGKHAPISYSFRSGLQYYCKECKRERVNPTLNPLRAKRQLGEAAQTRRMYGRLAGEKRRLSRQVVFERFGGSCFGCGVDLTDKPFVCDHTLPLSFLWPHDEHSSTLLCADCNNRKHDQWPSVCYARSDLPRLSELTGFPLEVLSGAPRLNPAVVELVLGDVNAFVQRWRDCPKGIQRILGMIARLEGRRIDLTGVDLSVMRFGRPTEEVVVLE